MGTDLLSFATCLPAACGVYQMPRTRGSPCPPSISAVSAQTNASSRSGEPPPERPSAPKSHSLAKEEKYQSFQTDEFCNTSSDKAVNLDCSDEVCKTENSVPAVSVNIAAMWLSQHRDEIEGSAIVFVRKHFDLSITEAVEALKRGHGLRYGGG